MHHNNKITVKNCDNLQNICSYEASVWAYCSYYVGTDMTTNSFYSRLTCSSNGNMRLNFNEMK